MDVDSEITLSEWTDDCDRDHEYDTDSDDMQSNNISAFIDSVESDACGYTQNLAIDDGITILHEGNVKYAWERDGLHGLFGLFFTREMRESIVEWCVKIVKTNKLITAIIAV